MPYLLKPCRRTEVARTLGREGNQASPMPRVESIEQDSVAPKSNSRSQLHPILSSTVRRRPKLLSYSLAILAWDAQSVSIPWHVTQGPSAFPVHLPSQRRGMLYPGANTRPETEECVVAQQGKGRGGPWLSRDRAGPCAGGITQDAR